MKRSVLFAIALPQAITTYLGVLDQGLARGRQLQLGQSPWVMQNSKTKQARGSGTVASTAQTVQICPASSIITSAQEAEMNTWPETTIRYCKVCQKETPHEIRAGAGMTARICVECMERGLKYELDRD